MKTDADLKDRLSFAIFWAMWVRGVTPPKLAKAIGKSPDTVRRWRDGETAPSVLDVGPLARALGVLFLVLSLLVPTNAGYLAAVGWIMLLVVAPVFYLLERASRPR